MRSGYYVAVTAALLVAAVSCQWSENRYLRRTVKSEELVGRWNATRLDVESSGGHDEEFHFNASAHHLVLNVDGTCKAETFLEPTNAGVWIIADVPCRWDLQNDPEHQALNLVLQLPAQHVLHISFYFDERDGKLLLWQYVDDPDAWKYIEFERS